MMEKKPRIAVASYILSAETMGRPGPTYQDAVYQAGGLGYLTGAVLSEEDADAVYRDFDGLILSGGMDINEEFLGEPAHEKSLPASRERDLTEILLAKRFIAGNKPILAICRGEQILNVVLGGRHDQHIFDRPEVVIDHQNFETRHEDEIMPDTLLASIFPGMTRLTVNSTHHQAVKTLAPGLTLCAVSTDGVIEGYSFGDRVLGVQWHPERMLDEGMKPIFDWFIEKCRS